MIEPSRVEMDGMPGASMAARLGNIEALLLAILNQLRNGVKTQSLSVGVTVPIVNVPTLTPVT